MIRRVCLIGSTICINGGFVLLNNAPQRDGVVMDLAARIGWVRITQFG